MYIHVQCSRSAAANSNKGCAASTDGQPLPSSSLQQLNFGKHKPSHTTPPQSNKTRSKATRTYTHTRVQAGRTADATQATKISSHNLPLVAAQATLNQLSCHHDTAPGPGQQLLAALLLHSHGVSPHSLWLQSRLHFLTTTSSTLTAHNCRPLPSHRASLAQPEESIKAPPEAALPAALWTCTAALWTCTAALWTFTTALNSVCYRLPQSPSLHSMWL
jgi:hypothetical protein